MAGKRILWVQVWGLAAIQGAISLTWVIYNLYLPDLLTQFGFAASLAGVLLVIENILAAVMEPLMGSLSDRVQRFVTTSFPFITVGLVAASFFFIAIPGTVTFINPVGLMRGLLLVVLVSWAIAMTIFRSPAMSLLGRYAFATELPLAASVLTLVGGLAGAMGPLASQFILRMGAIAAFGIGSFVLLAAAAALRATQPARKIEPDADEKGDRPNTPAKLSLTGLACAFGTGMGVALGFRLMLVFFPQLMVARGAEVATVSLLSGCIFLALTVMALPAGALAARLGNRIAMLVGLGAMAVLMLALTWTSSTIAIAVIALLWGGAFSLVANGTIPFALSLVPPARAGLGTGIYFSGGAVAMSIFGRTFGLGAIAPSASIISGAIACGLAATCIAATYRLKQS